MRIGEGNRSLKSRQRSSGSCARKHNSIVLVPQVPKEFCCRWPMPAVMVIRKCKNLQDFGVARQRFEYLNPVFQITRAINDCSVPCRGLLLNSLAVSKPANISKVRCDQIEP